MPGRFKVIVSILNESSQKKIPLGRNTIKRCIIETLKTAGMHPDKYEISLYFTDDNKMRSLNSQYRGHDRTTDVLSFPQFAPDAEISRNPEGSILLGDVAISLQTLYRRCLKRAEKPATELATILAHSILHLIGYDHATRKDRLRMRTIEHRVIDTLSL